MNDQKEVQIRIAEVSFQMKTAINIAQKKYPKLTMEEVANAILHITLIINEIEIEIEIEMYSGKNEKDKHK